MFSLACPAYFSRLFSLLKICIDCQLVNSQEILYLVFKLFSIWQILSPCYAVIKRFLSRVMHFLFSFSSFQISGIESGLPLHAVNLSRVMEYDHNKVGVLRYWVDLEWFLLAWTISEFGFNSYNPLSCFEMYEKCTMVYAWWWWMWAGDTCREI